MCFICLIFVLVGSFVAALCDRLLDYDENVRKQVVAVICDVACHSLSSIPVETTKLVAERLRDKSVFTFFSISACVYFYTWILFLNLFTIQICRYSLKSIR